MQRKRIKRNRSKRSQDRRESRSSHYNHTGDFQDSINNTTPNSQLQDSIPADLPEEIKVAIKQNLNRPRVCVFCGARTQNLGVFESGYYSSDYSKRDQLKFLFYGICNQCNAHFPDFVKGILLAILTKDVQRNGEEVNCGEQR